MRRAVTVAALAMTLIVAALPAPAARAGTTCYDPTDPLCFDVLPRDDVWERAIRLPAVPGWWEGDGVAVASIDTGVTPNRTLWSRAVARLDFTAEGDGIDHFGHGTHIAGLIASNGASSERAYEGAAPEADLVSLKVAGWDGATDVTTVIAALRWATSNRDKYGIRVVNLSWGTDGVQPTDIDPLDAAVARAWHEGLVVVVAAGNTAGRVTKPGDDPHVITVGAADIAGTAAGDDDTVAAFSARGTAADPDAKPDVLAPGVSLISDRARGSTIDLFNPTARIGWSLFKGTGTSQAAAVVSGVVARMLDANPSLTPDQVKAVLTHTTGGLRDADGAGAGMIDAGAAVGMAASARTAPEILPQLDGDPPADSTGTGTLAGARGEFTVSGDLDKDGTPEALATEVDALGDPWDATHFMQTDWTADTWEQSAWAPLVAEIPYGTPVPTDEELQSRPAPPQLVWDATYWPARSPEEANWDARYWGARYWGARYWGTDEWR